MYRALVLCCRDLKASKGFFEILLDVRSETDTFIEYTGRRAGGFAVILKVGGERTARYDGQQEVQGEAMCSTGYSPMLNLDIAGMDEKIGR